MPGEQFMRHHYGASGHVKTDEPPPNDSTSAGRFPIEPDTIEAAHVWATVYAAVLSDPQRRMMGRTEGYPTPREEARQEADIARRSWILSRVNQ